MHQHENTVAEPYYGQDEDGQKPAVPMEQPPEKETKRGIKDTVGGRCERHKAELHVRGLGRVGK